MAVGAHHRGDLAVAHAGLHFHDLRHTGNQFAAQSGAALRDLMARIGHDSDLAAMIYLHEARALIRHYGRHRHACPGRACEATMRTVRTACWFLLANGPAIPGRFQQRGAWYGVVRRGTGEYALGYDIPKWAAD